MNRDRPAEEILGVEIVAPAVVVVSGFDYDLLTPVVCPATRNRDGTHRVHVTELDVRRELELLVAAGVHRSRQIDVVAPADAQAFIDARAEELARAHREATQDVGRLKVYGFTEEQIAVWSREPKKKGEVL